MAENINQDTENSEIVDKAKGFWDRNGRNLLLALAGVAVIAGGLFAYRNLVHLPNEQKAQEELFRAEENFRRDSLALALNGDATTPGFLKVIKKYGGTSSGNAARLYAGICHLQLGEYQKAIDQLEDVNPNGAAQLQAKCEGLLGDAYSELKKNDKAIDHYRKASSIFPDDVALSSEYLFRAALLLELSGKNKEAAEAFQQLKEKFPRTEKGFIADKYLARLGASEK
jgi:tetratricopeptide (TPR) repeat protein